MKEGRRDGTRAKPGNQLVYYICIHLLDPYWTMSRQAVISTQQTHNVPLTLAQGYILVTEF